MADSSQSSAQLESFSNETGEHSSLSDDDPKTNLPLGDMDPHTQKAEAEVPNPLSTVVCTALVAELQDKNPMCDHDSLMSKDGNNQDVKCSEEKVRDHNLGSSESSHGERCRSVVLPPGIDLSNIIPMENLSDSIEVNHDELASAAVQIYPSSSAPTSSYTLRSRGTKQKKLVYDLKYHPMDDSVRPVQAAKCRLAHGEHLIVFDNSSARRFEHTDTDADCSITVNDGSGEDQEEGVKAWKQTVAGKKRKSAPRPTSDTLRRTTRKVTARKISYNMAVHPQDDDLQLLSADDADVTYSRRKRGKHTHALSKPEYASQSYDDDSGISEIVPCESNALTLDGNNLKDAVVNHKSPLVCETTVDKHTSPIFYEENAIPGVTSKLSRPVSSANTLPLFGIRRKEDLNMWELPPGHRSFRHERDSWPISPGQPFDIYTEGFEDQLAAEALSTLPFDYEDDNKENVVDDQVNDTVPDPLEGIFLIPASLYRQSSNDVPASYHTLYDECPQIYGLGVNNGTDMYVQTGGNKTLSDSLCLLRSGQHLPRVSTSEGSETLRTIVASTGNADDSDAMIHDDGPT